MTHVESVRFEHSDGIARVTLNRPERRNAVDLEMRTALRTVIDRLRGDSTIRAAILQGSGGSFCAGGDITVMRDPAGTETRRARMREASDLAVDLLTLDKPLIAVVEGPAYGAGFGMAMVADFVLAAPDARFCASFGRIGLIPDFLLHHTLPRLVGLARARELIFSAREIGADEALGLGLVHRIHPAEALDQAASTLAANLATVSPTTFALSKSLLNQSHTLDPRQVAEAETAGQALCFQTEYHRDAAQRFLDRQPTPLIWRDY